MARKRCPHKWKRAFDTPADAKKALGAMYAQLGKAIAGEAVYECPAGHWHIGSSRVKKRQHWQRQMGRR